MMYTLRFDVETLIIATLVFMCNNDWIVAV